MILNLLHAISREKMFTTMPYSKKNIDTALTTLKASCNRFLYLQSILKCENSFKQLRTIFQRTRFDTKRLMSVEGVKYIIFNHLSFN